MHGRRQNCKPSILESGAPNHPSIKTIVQLSNGTQNKQPATSSAFGQSDPVAQNTFRLWYSSAFRWDLTRACEDSFDDGFVQNAIASQFVGSHSFWVAFCALLEDYYGSSSLQNDEASTLHTYFACTWERANDLSRTVPFLATLPNIFYLNYWTVLFFLDCYFSVSCVQFSLIVRMTWHDLAWHRWKALTHMRCVAHRRYSLRATIFKMDTNVDFKNEFFFILSHWRAYSTQIPAQISLGIFRLK